LFTPIQCVHFSKRNKKMSSESSSTTAKIQEPPPNPNLHRQGLLNFEKVLGKLESILPSAIGQRKSQNSAKKQIEAWNQEVANANNNSSDSNNNYHNQQKPQEENPTSDVIVAEALFNCIQTMFVDGDACNVPPSNFSLVPGLTTAECLSADYPKLVRDYKRVRDKWNKRALETSSQTHSSRSSSVTSSVANRRRERGELISVAKPKFGKSKIVSAPQFSANNNNDDNRNDNDDDETNFNERSSSSNRRQFLSQEHDQQQHRFDAADHYRKMQEFDEIGAQVRSVRDLSQEINGLLENQQGVLDTAETNIEKAASHTEKGRENLFSAVKITSFGAGLAGGVIGALVGGPAGFVLGAQSGAAIAASMGVGGVVGGVVAKKISNAAVASSADAETDRKFDQMKHDLAEKK
jgi:hypothetical protein